MNVGVAHWTTNHPPKKQPQEGEPKLLNMGYKLQVFVACRKAVKVQLSDIPFVRPEALLFEEVFVPVAKGVRVGKLKADTVHVDALKVAHLVPAWSLPNLTLDKYESPSSCHRPKLPRSDASQRDRQTPPFHLQL